VLALLGVRGKSKTKMPCFASCLFTMIAIGFLIRGSPDHTHLSCMFEKTRTKDIRGFPNRFRSNQFIITILTNR
jgi:hypothetical protein